MMRIVPNLVSAIAVIAGLVLVLFGLAAKPHSNPAESVQIVLWASIIGGIALVVFGVAFAPLRTSKGTKKQPLDRE